MKRSINLFITLCLFFLGGVSYAQPGAETEVKNKPAKYENRKLASEKTGEKKFNVPRRFMQNTTTHYNYYFNASNRLNDVVARAKASFKDDYSRLLPFYNYTLETTAQDKGELDSVIYKSTAGILLHDLRSDWVDNMYLLLAKAYFYRNDLDSATMTLQYLNFAFAPKEEGGYDIPIGSNASNESGEFSISTKEKRSIWKKLTGRPPSRNESFIWQIRSYIEHNELPEAAGLIEILKNDPQFPKRLQTDLNEVIAHWYYKQEIFDSSAFHLSQALDEAASNQEKARWEYLIGQMYQRSNKNDLAVQYYNRSISHTTDPIMDVYARLNALKINPDDKKDYRQENIDALVKMAKRDKYLNYRDIIYYAAATIELDRKGYDAAENFLLKSVKNTLDNPRQRSQSFLLLADMNYDLKKYTPASNFYDSTDINSLASQVEKDRVLLRKPPLKIVAANELIVYSQDSLQALAKLPADKRDAVIKKKIKELRKAQGIKEEEPQSSNPAILQKQDADLFADNTKSTDFYFYNASLKARGFSEFKAKWGERPNVDNWRRSSAVNRQSVTPGDIDAVVETPAAEGETGPTETSYEGLLSKVPLTEEKLTTSNKSIEEALFTLGGTFQSKLEDYPSAIEAYEELLKRFPNTSNRNEALFNLVYAYQKTGDKTKSDDYKNQLLTSADTSKWAQIIKNPELGKQEDISKSPATRKYEQIYNMFIEGDFENAKSEKKTADSVYGKSHWTPQLLYIESIYYVKQKDDSTAIKVLTDLSTTFNASPMAEKAQTMIDVLRRRMEIEDYLTKLEITRNGDRPVAAVPVREKQEVAAAPKTITAQPQVTLPKDSVQTPIKTPAKTEPPIVKTPEKTEPPVVKTPEKKETPVVAKKDSPVAVVAPPIVVKTFSFVPADPHFVVVVLDKVDQVYASEAKNAFNRFNREKYYNKPIEMTSLQLDERFHLVLEGPFSDANAAVAYIDNVRPVAGSRILPWLTADKYNFIVISAANLDVLKTNKDMNAYKQLLQQAFPGKF
jgi:tetratricopeptide (TPR) repeat protein